VAESVIANLAGPSAVQAAEYLGAEVEHLLALAGPGDHLGAAVGRMW
jgi:hypothetical protein